MVGWTRGWERANVPKPQSVPAMTFSLPTTLAKRTMRSATRSGCSTKLVTVSITPGIRTLPSGKAWSVEDAPLVAVARIGALDGQALGVHAVQHVDDLGQRHVAHVRPLVVAPAHVQADAIGGDAGRGR